MRENVLFLFPHSHIRYKHRSGTHCGCYFLYIGAIKFISREKLRIFFQSFSNSNIDIIYHPGPIDTNVMRPVAICFA